MKNRWTNYEIETLKEKYSEYGATILANILNRSEISIKSKASLLGLTINQKLKNEIQKNNCLKRNYNKHENDFKVKIDFFKNNFTPESVYTLGLLWSDGYVYYKGRGKKNLIVLKVLIEDGLYFYEKISKTGDWNSYERYIKNKNPQYEINTNNKPLCELLVNEYEYDKKTFISPNKLLNHIPNNLKKYFYLGVIDGDGCFYFNLKNKQYQFSVSSSYEQNWEYLENLFNTLNINYSISRRIHKKSKSSAIRIVNKKDICKLGEYLYSDIEINDIGLKRKYQKYLVIKDLYRF